MTKFLLPILFLVSNFSFAATDVDRYFSGLKGKWYGEVPGIYKATLEFGEFSADRPWALQKGSLTIEEGDVTKYEFELSQNQSALDQEPVYFLKLKNVNTQTAELLTLSHRSDASKPFSFWNQIVTTEKNITFTTANGIKIFLTDKELTWGFVYGNGYCAEKDLIKICASDGYRPFQLLKVQ